MKVICAGYPKTGTKSIASALRILEYNQVYDALESIDYGLVEWYNIFSGASDDIDGVLDRVYSNGVEAVVDLPHSYFFEYFHKRWPDAKVILTVREEKAWYDSFKKMQDDIKKKTGKVFAILPLLSKTQWYISEWYKLLLRAALGSESPNWLKWTLAYRRHNAHVKSVIPSDQLLIYDVKDGWEPICKFLGKEIPSEEFPFMNKAGSMSAVVKTIRKESKAVQNIYREVAFNLSVIMLSLGIGCVIISRWK